MGRSGFWDSSKAFSKLTAIRPTIRSAGREWYMRLVGPMLEDSFSRRYSYIHEIRLQLRLWRGWTNCLPLTPKLAAEELALLGVMLCVRKEPSLYWMISGARSRQHSPLHCPPVHSARPANTRSRCGENLHGSWNIR